MYNLNSQNTEYSGTPFVISAPSGAGKSSLVQALLNDVRNLELSISSTTRNPRPNEKDGVHYHFTTQQEFMNARDQGDFIEWAEVYSNFYGTRKSFVESKLKNNCDVILEIDWQGAFQIMKKLSHVVSIFILPPSIEELKKRLIGRATDSEEIIELRMQKAKSEIEQSKKFDFIIINEDFQTALLELKSIVIATRCRYKQQRPRHTEKLKTLGL